MSDTPAPASPAGPAHPNGEYDHDGTFRHHHDDLTGDPIWWLNAEHFGGEKREHRHPASPAGLDVERLARAMRDSVGVKWPVAWVRNGDNFDWIARQIAAEYARLQSEASEAPAPRGFHPNEHPDWPVHDFTTPPEGE